MSGLMGATPTPDLNQHGCDAPLSAWRMALADIAQGRPPQFWPVFPKAKNRRDGALRDQIKADAACALEALRLSAPGTPLITHALELVPKFAGAPGMNLKADDERSTHKALTTRIIEWRRGLMATQRGKGKLQPTHHAVGEWQKLLRIVSRMQAMGAGPNNYRRLADDYADWRREGRDRARQQRGKTPRSYSPRKTGSL